MGLPICVFTGGTGTSLAMKPHWGEVINKTHDIQLGSAPWKDGENSGEQRGHVTSTSGGQERESRQTVESEERCPGTASASEGGSRRLHEWDELGEAGGWVRPESQALGPPPVRQTAPNSPHPMLRLQREMSLRCGVKEVTEPHGAI